MVILDSRIATKRYGQVIFASLPPARRVIGATRDVLAEVDAFFADRALAGLNDPLAPPAPRPR